MSKERAPMLACVIPIFEFLISQWKKMLAKPSLVHLHRMLEAGLNKFNSKYDEYRFSKPVIFSIGMLFTVSLLIF